MTDVDNKLLVERIRHYETNTVEYRLRISLIYTVSAEIDGQIPDKLIAGMLGNAMRECVNSAKIDHDVCNTVAHMKRKSVFTCPTCGQIVER